jgi:hypothetical protein
MNWLAENTMKVRAAAVLQKLECPGLIHATVPFRALEAERSPEIPVEMTATNL